MATKLPLQFEITSILTYLSSINKKSYCFPSQNKILELLFLRYCVQISRRTLNRYLRSLERAGNIDRTRRIKTLPDGGLSFRSTLYTIKKAAYRYLARCMYQLKACGIRLREKVRKSNYLLSEIGSPGERLNTEEAKEFLSLALSKCNG